MTSAASRLRERLRDWVPPALWRRARAASGRTLRFSKRWPSWAAAAAACPGYADADIVERVAAATRAVVAGKAAYEQDSVLFAAPSYPFHVVATLLRAAGENGGRLRVVDFGGSMGSTYRRCRPFLTHLAAVDWQVVEQPAFVAVAEREFRTSELGFARSVAELAPSAVAPVVLLSSVLQYLEEPDAVLDALRALSPAWVVVDRTPVSSEADDRICIQTTPRHIYAARYPCRILARGRLLDRLARFGAVVAEVASDDGEHTTDDGIAFRYRGWVVAANGLQPDRRSPGAGVVNPTSP